MIGIERKEEHTPTSIPQALNVDHDQDLNAAVGLNIVVVHGSNPDTNDADDVYVPAEDTPLDTLNNFIATYIYEHQACLIW